MLVYHSLNPPLTFIVSNMVPPMLMQGQVDQTNELLDPGVVPTDDSFSSLANAGAWEYCNNILGGEGIIQSVYFIANSGMLWEHRCLFGAVYKHVCGILIELGRGMWSLHLQDIVCSLTSGCRHEVMVCTRPHTVKCKIQHMSGLPVCIPFLQLTSSDSAWVHSKLSHAHQH